VRLASVGEGPEEEGREREGESRPAVLLWLLWLLLPLLLLLEGSVGPVVVTSAGEREGGREGGREGEGQSDHHLISLPNRETLHPPSLPPSLPTTATLLSFFLQEVQGSLGDATEFLKRFGMGTVVDGKRGHDGVQGPQVLGEGGREGGRE